MEATNFLSSLAALLAAYLALQSLVFLFRRKRLHQTFERMQIPSPPANLIDGHLFATRRHSYVAFAHKMHERYGKNVGFYLGGDPFIMSKDLELIQQVFVAKSRLFYDRMPFYLNVEPVPDNLICQRGDRWRYMRRLLTPAFSTARIRSSHFYRDTQLTVRKLMQQLDDNSLALGQPDTPTRHQRVTYVEDAYDRMAAVALDVIIKTAFHMDDMISFSGALTDQLQGKRSAEANDWKQLDLGSLIGLLIGRLTRLLAHLFQPTKVEESAECEAKLSAQRLKRHQDAFLATLKRACRLGFNPLVQLIFCFPFLDKPLTYLCNHLYFGSILQLLLKRLEQLVRRPSAGGKKSAREGCGEQANESAGLAQRRRIIDSLVEVLRDRKITRSEFTGNAFVIVFAGFETTANALTFTLWLLAKHERVQTKLRNELLEQIASHEGAQIPDGDLSDDQLARLATGCAYLENVINESLRLYPPVPGLSCRQASADCVLAGGLRVERGVNVVPSVFSIHRDRSIWGEQAHEFQPERFEVLDVAQLNSAMFMPFGLGPRNCIGKALAMHELKIVVGRLVLGYSVECWTGRTPDKLKLCSPINITITNADKIALKFVKLNG